MSRNRWYPYLVTVVIMAFFFTVTKYVLPIFDSGDFSSESLGKTTIFLTLLQLALTLVIVLIMKKDGSYPVLDKPGFRLDELFRPVLGWVFILFKFLAIGAVIRFAPPDVVQFRPLAILLALVFSFSIGFFEEYLFRGFLFKNMIKDRDESAVMSSALISSFLFGLFHIDFSMVSSGISIGTFGIVIFAFGVGLYLAAVTYRFGKMWVPVVIHALIDFPTFLMIALVDTSKLFDLLEPLLEGTTPSVTDFGMEGGSPIVYGLGLIFLVAGYRMLRKAIHVKQQERLTLERLALGEEVADITPTNGDDLIESLASLLNQDDSKDN